MSEQDQSTTAEEESTPEGLTADDFYLEGPFVVFTAAYHLKRGFCCESQCRHCPFK